MINILNIIEGCGNNLVIKLFRKDYKIELQLLRSVRLEICNSCKLFNNGSCDNEKVDKAVTNFRYMNTDRFINQEYKGCGCIIDCKTLVPHEVCPLGKWLPITLE